MILLLINRLFVCLFVTTCLHDSAMIYEYR